MECGDDGVRLVGFAQSLPLEVLEMILTQLAPEDLFCLQRVTWQTEALVEHWLRLHPPSSLHFTHFLTGLWQRGFFNSSQAIGQTFDWMAAHFKDARVLCIARITLEDLKKRCPRDYMYIYTWSLQLMKHFGTFLKNYSSHMKLDSLLVEQTSPDGAPMHLPSHRHYLKSFFTSLQIWNLQSSDRLGLREIVVQEPLGVEDSDEIRALSSLINANTLEVVRVNCSSTQNLEHMREVAWSAMTGQAIRVVQLHRIPDTQATSILVGAGINQALCSLELLSSDPTVPFPMSPDMLHRLLLVCQKLSRFHFSVVAVSAVFEKLTTYWPPKLKDVGLRWEPLSPTMAVWFSLFATRGAKLQSLKVWSTHPDAVGAVGGIALKLPGLQCLDLSAIPSISKQALDGILADLHSPLRQISLPSSTSFGASTSMPRGMEIAVQYDK